MSSELFTILQWQTPDKGISMLSANLALGLGPILQPGDRVTARYNNTLLPAKILHVGELEDIQKLMDKIQPQPTMDTNSPKGRGHRVTKRKALPDDFVSSVAEVEDVLIADSKKENTSRQLQKRAKSVAGHDIIEMLLQKRCAEDDDNSEASDSGESSVSHSEKIRNLQKEVESGKARIRELEKLNGTLLKGLPDVVTELEDLVKTVRNRALTDTTSATTRKTKVAAESTDTPTCSSVDDSIVIDEDMEVDKEIISRALCGKSVSKVVCNLLRAFFSREVMAKASLTGKSSSNEKREKLDGEMVEKITKLTLQKFPGTERGFIRGKMAEKLKDERKAFFGKKEVKSTK